MQEWYLGWEKVSSFQECPYRGVPLCIYCTTFRLISLSHTHQSVKQFRSQVAEEKGIVVASLTSRVGFTPHQLSASHLPKPPLTAAAALLERLTARANLSNTTTTVNTVSSGSTAVVDKTLNTTTSSGLESSSQVCAHTLVLIQGLISWCFAHTE